jgi:hypothetical protein
MLWLRLGGYLQICFGVSLRGAGAINLVSLIRECALYALVEIRRMPANLFWSKFKRS